MGLGEGRRREGGREGCGERGGGGGQAEDFRFVSEKCGAGWKHSKS